MKKLIITIALALVLFFMFYSGLLTYRGLCGFTSRVDVNALIRSGKEWPCSCVGIKEIGMKNYSEKLYCTGINFSYNRLNGLFNKNLQRPVYKPENL